MKQRLIVMLGTAVDSRGGVSSVVRAYVAGGLFSRWPVLYLATHCDGGAVTKFLQAVASLLRFICMLVVGRVALVHIHLASRASFWRKFIFFLPAILSRVPVLVHLHGGGFQDFYSSSSVPIQASIRFMFGRASAVLVLSKAWDVWLSSICSAARSVVLPNPVALSVPSRPIVSKRLVFLGHICKAKGCYDLLEAVALLAPLHPKLQLVLAGEGDLEALSAYAAALGVEHIVELPGYVGVAERERLLAGAAALVLPSYAEGLPMCLLEAMAVSLPVVASRVGGIPDLVEDGVDGLLVSAGDVVALAAALDGLLKEPARAHALGAAGRVKIAEHFVAEKVLPQLEQLYGQYCSIDSQRRT